MNYLNDFLHMMYKPIVEGELQVTTVCSEEWKLRACLYDATTRKMRTNFDAFHEAPHVNSVSGEERLCFYTSEFKSDYMW
jgi:hypothetical protein